MHDVKITSSRLSVPFSLAHIRFGLPHRDKIFLGVPSIEYCESCISKGASFTLNRKMFPNLSALFEDRCEVLISHESIHLVLLELKTRASIAFDRICEDVELWTNDLYRSSGEP